MVKILLVEDDKILLEMYRDKFSHDNFQVQTAQNGEDCLSKMKSFTPDIVLLDLLMPKMTGFEVLKIIKKEPSLSKIPIMVLTNVYADAEDLVKNWGVTYFLAKVNNTPEQVVKKVKSILKRREITESLRQQEE